MRVFSTYCISSGLPIHSKKKTWLVSEYSWHFVFFFQSILSQFRGEKWKNKNKRIGCRTQWELLWSVQFCDLALTGCRVAPASPLAEWRSEERWTRGVWWEEPPLCRAHWADKEAGPQPWQWMPAPLPWEYWTFMATRWRFSSLFAKRIELTKRPYVYAAGVFNHVCDGPLNIRLNLMRLYITGCRSLYVLL